jgi:hypothetical protein
MMLMSQWCDHHDLRHEVNCSKARTLWQKVHDLKVI